MSSNKNNNHKKNNKKKTTSKVNLQKREFVKNNTKKKNLTKSNVEKKELNKVSIKNDDSKELKSKKIDIDNFNNETVADEILIDSKDIVSLVKALHNNDNDYVKPKKTSFLKKLFIFVIIIGLVFLTIKFVKPKSKNILKDNKIVEKNTKKENNNQKKKKKVETNREIDEEKVTEIPIFTFHRIVSDDLKHEKFEEDEWVASADVFEEQIKYLYDNGYKTISMDEFYCWYRKACDFPKKTVMLTFDDGNADDYFVVMPIIKKYNFKATTFIVGARTLDVDENPYDENVRTFITRELMTKAKNIYPNWEFQSHTWDLHFVDSNKKEHVLNLSKEEIDEDFEQNKSFHFKYLAYPFGIYNDEIIESLKKYKYNLAFTFRVHEKATRKSKQYEIPRIKINGFSDVEEIKKWLEED